MWVPVKAWVACQLLIGAVSMAREEDIFFQIHDPRSLRYIFRGKMARDFGGVFRRVHRKALMVIADPPDACQELHNVLSLTGNIALIQRGVCSFAEKAEQAQKAGAIAAIIYDNDENNFNAWVHMVKEDYDYVVHIPALFINGRDGNIIVEKLQEAGLDSAIITVPINETDIGIFDYTPWTQF
eukprot:m.223308 g.223308  ORF g.223308 m.223308 type:complete len:183 (-) comp15942_c0_seq7:1285-1833(-)